MIARRSGLLASLLAPLLTLLVLLASPRLAEA